MALVSRPVEIPVPCPSPARVGSTGTILYLLQKERPSDQQACTNRGSPGSGVAKSSKEFVHVCREVVSVSCGQPLLSYKPKRSKSSKVAKSSESKVVPTKCSGESNVRSASNRAVANVVWLTGVGDVVPSVELGRGDALAKASASMNGKTVDFSPVRRSFSPGDGSESDADKKSALVPSSESEDNATRGEYPVFQLPSTSRSAKPPPDDYHKALIPFLRAEWDASAKVLKRRQFSQVPKTGGHRRSTSLGNPIASVSPTTDQKAWQSYTRDSYPPFSTPKKHSFFRLSSGGSSEREHSSR